MPGLSGHLSARARQAAGAPSGTLGSALASCPCGFTVVRAAPPRALAWAPESHPDQPLPRCCPLSPRPKATAAPSCVSAHGVGRRPPVSTPARQLPYLGSGTMWQGCPDPHVPWYCRDSSPPIRWHQKGTLAGTEVPCQALCCDLETHPLTLSLSLEGCGSRGLWVSPLPTTYTDGRHPCQPRPSQALTLATAARSTGPSHTRVLLTAVQELAWGLA